MPRGKPEDLDGFRLRIPDPVFGNTEPLAGECFTRRSEDSVVGDRISTVRSGSTT